MWGSRGSSGGNQGESTEEEHARGVVEETRPEEFEEEELPDINEAEETASLMRCHAGEAVGEGGEDGKVADDDDDGDGDNDGESEEGEDDVSTSSSQLSLSIIPPLGGGDFQERPGISATENTWGTFAEVQVVEEEAEGQGEREKEKESVVPTEDVVASSKTGNGEENLRPEEEKRSSSLVLEKRQSTDEAELSLESSIVLEWKGQQKRPHLVHLVHVPVHVHTLY